MRWLLSAGRTYALRAAAGAYLREHLDQLLARFPDRGDNTTASLAYLFLGSCAAARRDDVAAFVKQTFGSYIGAERVIAQGLESFDICVARRRLLAPRFEAWLAKR
ncbi:MAG TPA: hypothetical protein VFD36_32080 [Kofleriaceae bacterium]|nr:hypothetical protein [Kofleriaceae bacterium]